MDLSNEARLPRGRGKPKAFSNATQCQEQKGFGWMENDRIEKKRNALLISFRLCRLKFSLEIFCLRLWEEGREFETATGSIPRNVEDFWPTPDERMGEGLECYGLWKG